jgi:hypothetical protein
MFAAYAFCQPRKPLSADVKPKTSNQVGEIAPCYTPPPVVRSIESHTNRSAIRYAPPAIRGDLITPIE